MAITRVALDSTETLVSSPRVTRGRLPVLGAISSAYVRIGTPTQSVPDEDSWEAATVDPVSVLLSGTSNNLEGDTTLAFTPSSTTYRGRPYVAIPLNGEPFVVECAQTKTGIEALISSPLPRTLEPFSTLKGFSVTKALTAEQTATAGPGIAHWKAIIDGQAIQWSSSFRIVRRMPVIPLTTGELQVAYPQVMRMRDVDDSALEELISTAWEHRVLPRLAAKGIIDENIVDSEPLRPLTALACMLHLVTMDESGSQQWRESLQAEYDRLVESTIARVDWYEAPQDTTAPPAVQSTPRRTGIRVHR